MRLYLSLVAFCISALCFSQDKPLPTPTSNSPEKAVKPDPKATIDQYRIMTIDKDTTFVDTSLTIQSEYKFNYLRRDNFGLLPFSNEGQPYNLLQFSLLDFSPFPTFGHDAKQYSYVQANEINYYSVATPLSELYFKSVMEQGQSLNSLIALNTSDRLNFSIGYRGIRSLGKYINQLSSIGNFKFTTTYNTKNKRYYANFHFTGQDILNGENGGISNTDDFESKDASFKNRARLEVYFNDAQSFMKGKRAFIDHNFRVNREKSSNNLYVSHQLNYEYKFFEYSQPTVASTLTDDNGQTTSYNRFGDTYQPSNIDDRVRYNRLYNKVGASYENATLGKFTFFAEDFRYNYFFNKILILDAGTVPAALSGETNTVGGQYEYRTGKWNGKFTYLNSVAGQALSNIDAGLTYTINPKNRLSFRYQNLNKIPDLNYNLHQSSYVGYNWNNDFKNEKINTIEAHAFTQWANASLQLRTLNDWLYFSNDRTDSIQIVTPKQYASTINYISLKVSREFRYGKFALDNTLLYQKVAQDDDILNVPQFTTRNTLYYSNHFFKRALYLQTGIILNYFTKYFADDHNPVLAEFFVQNQKEIGDFPLLDFFINVRVRQTRLFLKAEHFNSGFTGNQFYATPNHPYRDFLVRFGLVWNFFQ